MSDVVFFGVHALIGLVVGITSGDQTTGWTFRIFSLVAMSVAWTLGVHAAGLR